MKRKIQAANSELTDGQIQAMLRRWFVEAEGAVQVRRRGSTPLTSHSTHSPLGTAAGHTVFLTVTKSWLNSGMDIVPSVAHDLIYFYLNGVRGEVLERLDCVCETVPSSFRKCVVF